jgi:hypothetical protein
MFKIAPCRNRGVEMFTHKDYEHLDDICVKLTVRRQNGNMMLIDTGRLCL